MSAASSPPFDPVQAERLRELAEAATPGPWIRSESRPWVVTAEARNGFDLAYCGPKPPDPGPLRAKHDAAFIAACDPQTVLALLDLLAGQAEQIEQLTRDLDEALGAMWAAYVKTGADTDGDERWHCAPEQAGTVLIDAVRTLRADYGESLGTLQRIADEATDDAGWMRATAKWALRAAAVGEGGQDA